MTQTYFPFDSGAGSAITESQWREMASLWLSDGVIRGADDALAVSEHAAAANKTVDVATGQAWVDGHFYKSDAVENLAISANASGNDRIDLIVLKADFTANTITSAVVEGTAAATPVPPGVTQSSSVWEIPLAQVAVANGFTSIADADITDVRQYAAGKQDWQHVPGTLTFSSDTDAPTFVMTATDDLTGIIPLGARFRCVQSGGVVYGIVTAVASGSLTIYGGTDYTLADEAVSSPEFSIAKVPVGFNADPEKWFEEVVDTTDRSVVSPTTGTWYNPGSISLSIPIGAWLLSWQATIVSGGAATVDATLSTSSNSASDTDLMAEYSFGQAGDSSGGRNKPIALAAKTTYYHNVKCRSGTPASIGLYAASSGSPTILRAICAYL